MRVFGIKPDGQFRDYIQTPFQVDHQESILEDWLESNPDGIVEMAKTKSMPIHWGNNGFSLNVNIDETHVTICFVYPPDSV
mgnify:CR=1 FL=1